MNNDIINNGHWSNNIILPCSIILNNDLINPVHRLKTVPTVNNDVIKRGQQTINGLRVQNDLINHGNRSTKFLATKNNIIRLGECTNYRSNCKQ